jgi:hypothetical protein
MNGHPKAHAPGSWRNEFRFCPDCGEKYWPTRRTSKSRWDEQTKCMTPRCIMRGPSGANAARAARKNQMRKGDVV